MAATLGASLVESRLDYANSIMDGMSGLSQCIIDNSIEQAECDCEHRGQITLNTCYTKLFQL